MLCAGLYLFRSFEYKPQTPGAYLKRRFWRFFPWIAVAFVVSFCIKNFLLSPVASVEELYERASKSVWELLMVEMNGLNGDQFPINVASWTVSTMLIVGTVIWGCLYYYGEKFRDFFMPVSILVLLGVWVHFENLSNSKWHVLFTAGMVRTWIEMCLGYYCLRLSELITVKDNPRVRKIALALIESLGYGLVLLSIYNGATRWHQLMTLLLMIPVVAITASGQSAWQDFFAWLTERLRISFDCVSFCVYLIHVPVILLFQSRYGSVFDADRTPYSARFFVCVALAAVVYYFCTKWLIKAFRKMAVPWKRFWTGA